MSTKELNNNYIKDKSLLSNNKIMILNKIKHKPSIVESLYSFALKRPYILLDFINKDKYLKLAMNNVFVKLTKKNDLSPEINKNINTYLKYKTILEQITSKKEHNSNKSKNIYKDFQKAIQKDKKKSKKFYKINTEKKSLDEEIQENLKFKEISIIKDIIAEIRQYFDKDLKSFIFDYLSSLGELSLYNVQYENNLDSEYLNYISKFNVKQNIELLCIIDRFNYSQFIDIIAYPNIISLHFSLFSYENFTINNIFNIFMNYIITIKHNYNIKKISFGDEFFQNNFIYNKDLYFQSFISYAIDQYMETEINKSENIFTNINLDEVILKEDNLDNIYERYKILYGFHKMFLNIKNIKLLFMRYSDILTDNQNFYNNKYKIILIDFMNEPITELNIIIKNINSFISNYRDRFINVEILSFYNFNLTNKEKDIMNMNTNSFEDLPNLKEFFINNNNNKIAENEKINIKNNNFIYLYLGYDSNNNLIYYRNGANQIKSTDILDIFNIINKNITKLFLVYEKITISINKTNSELKIVNHSNYKIDDFYFYPLKNLSDFIYNYKYYKNLIIEGFNFIFKDLKSSIAEKLYINYIFYKNQEKKIYEYKYKLNDEIDKKNINKDINLKSNFPKLEEIYIGNMNEEKNFYKKLCSENRGLKINIICSEKMKFNKKHTNISIKYSDNTNDTDNNKIIVPEYEEEEEEEDNYEEENEFDYYDKDEGNVIVNAYKYKYKWFTENEKI